MSAPPPAVLLVAEGGESGGIGRYCVDLAGAMGSRAGVVCLCPGPCDAGDCWLADQCASRGVHLESVRMPPKAWRTGLAGVLRVWRRAGKPLLHVNGRRGNAIALIARLIAPGLRYVTTVHGVLGLHDRRNAFYRLVDLAAGRGARAVIAVSRDTQRRLLAAGSPPTRTHVVINALAAPEAAALRAVADARWQATRVDGPVRIGFLGRLSREKGTNELVEVAQALHAGGTSARVTVGGDGPERAWMTESSQPLVDQGFLTFQGEVRDVARFLGEIDVLLMPSHNEGLPYVLLEAMAAGSAVVAFDVGGIPEVVSDSSLGILVRRRDVVGLVAALTRLSDDRETVVTLGRAAADHVSSQFALEKRLPLLSQVYGVDIVDGDGVDRAARTSAAG